MGWFWICPANELAGNNGAKSPCDYLKSVSPVYPTIAVPEGGLRLRLPANSFAGQKLDLRLLQPVRLQKLAIGE
jgi:hypothetical protein